MRKISADTGGPMVTTVVVAAVVGAVPGESCHSYSHYITGHMI